jgi:hypothetical protein
MGKTYNEMFEEAMACQTPEEGAAWLDDYAKSLVEEYPDYNPNEYTAKQNTLHNIGYMTGYYGEKEANHIYKIFGIGHPIFGGSLITER